MTSREESVFYLIKMLLKLFICKINAKLLKTAERNINYSASWYTSTKWTTYYSQQILLEKWTSI